MPSFLNLFLLMFDVLGDEINGIFTRPALFIAISMIIGMHLPVSIFLPMSSTAWIQGSTV